MKVPVVDKKEFDELLKRLTHTPAEPRHEVVIDGKLGKVLPAIQPSEPRKA